MAHDRNGRAARPRGVFMFLVALALPVILLGGAIAIFEVIAVVDRSTIVTEAASAR